MKREELDDTRWIGITNKKYERDFRVPPQVVSTAFSVLIPLRRAPIGSCQALAAASNRLAWRSRPQCQTERHAE